MNKSILYGSIMTMIIGSIGMYFYDNYQKHSPDVIMKSESIPTSVHIIRYRIGSDIRVWYRFKVDQKEYSHSDVWISKSKHCTDPRINNEQEYPVTVVKNITRGGSIHYEVSRGQLFEQFCR